MIGLSLLAVTVTVTLVGLAILCMVATRPDVALEPVGSPFGRTGLADPAADTLTELAQQQTLSGDWQEAELRSLTEVENLLDYLEVRNVRQREMVVLGDDRFKVRWR
jgi:hypothetical protein